MSVYAKEERQDSLSPLYSHICAFCGRLLGEDVNSDIRKTVSKYMRDATCGVIAQRLFLLFWHPSLLGKALPTVSVYLYVYVIIFYDFHAYVLFQVSIFFRSYEFLNCLLISTQVYENVLPLV